METALRRRQLSCRAGDDRPRRNPSADRPLGSPASCSPGRLLFGLGGTAAPAFGYLPALGGTELSLAPMRTMLAQPGLFAGVMLSLTAAWLVTAVALGSSSCSLPRGRGRRFSPRRRPGVAAAGRSARGGGLRAGVSHRTGGLPRQSGLAAADRLAAAARPHPRQRPGGARHDGRADRQGDPVPVADHSGSAAADRGRAHPGADAFAGIRADCRLLLGGGMATAHPDPGSRPSPCSPFPVRWSMSPSSSDRPPRRRSRSSSPAGCRTPTSRCGSWPRPAHCCSWR